MNPNFHKKKNFQRAIEGMFEKHIWYIYHGTYRYNIMEIKYKSVSIGYVLREWKLNTRKMFRGLSCVIYTIISKYVCIDYLGYEKMFLSDLLLDVSGRYKHLDKNYENILGFGKVRASRRKMNLLSYSNVLIGCLDTILIKDSFFLL